MIAVKGRQCPTPLPCFGHLVQGSLAKQRLLLLFTRLALRSWQSIKGFASRSPITNAACSAYCFLRCLDQLLVSHCRQQLYLYLGLSPLALTVPAGNLFVAHSEQDGRVLPLYPFYRLDLLTVCTVCKIPPAAQHQGGI